MGVHHFPQQINLETPISMKYIILAACIAAATAGVIPSPYPEAQSPPLPSFAHEVEQTIDTVTPEPELPAHPEAPSSNYVPPPASILEEDDLVAELRVPETGAPLEPETPDAELETEPEAEVPAEPETQDIEVSVFYETPGLEVPLVAEAPENTILIEIITPISHYVPPSNVSH